MLSLRLLCPPLLLLSLGLSPAAAADTPFMSALREGEVSLGLRLRFESVQQNNPLEDAQALTLRTALGYTTRRWQGFSAQVEMENIDALIDDYSGTPPPARFSVVADPEGTEINQWRLRYTGIEGLVASVGRSRLILDNARWVGNVGWRQNEQTFDGAFIEATPLTGLSLNGAYIRNINSIFFTNIDLDGVLLNARWEASPALSLSAYAYLLEYETLTAATPDADTWGLRAAGGRPLSPAVKLHYVAELARQQASAPAGEFTATYGLGELGLGYRGHALAVGYEVLGSDGGDYAVMTPLATLHAHNGWNDLFLVTPPGGLRDRYLRLTGKLGKAAWMVKAHDFRADRGDARYGSELNLQLGFPLIGALDGGLKYGAYSADTLGVDTDKFWAWLSWGF
jgi:hypothetical protein